MASNIDEFERAVEKAYETKVVQAFNEFHKRLTLEALKEVTTDSRMAGFAFGSPQWTGRFKASHNVSVGIPVGKDAPPHPEVLEGLRWPDEPDTPYPAPSLAAARRILDTQLQPFGKTFITNSLPYARKIEAGGFSFKAPEGVYNITASRLAAKYRRTTLKDLKISTSLSL